MIKEYPMNKIVKRANVEESIGGWVVDLGLIVEVVDRLRDKDSSPYKYAIDLDPVDVEGVILMLNDMGYLEIGKKEKANG